MSIVTTIMPTATTSMLDYCLTVTHSEVWQLKWAAVVSQVVASVAVSHLNALMACYLTYKVAHDASPTPLKAIPDLLSLLPQQLQAHIWTPK